MNEPAPYDWAANTHQPAQSSVPRVPSHDAVTLTKGGSRAAIHLNDQTYSLQITKQGKLLLTK